MSSLGYFFFICFLYFLKPLNILFEGTKAPLISPAFFCPLKEYISSCDASINTPSASSAKINMCGNSSGAPLRTFTLVSTLFSLIFSVERILALSAKLKEYSSKSISHTMPTRLFPLGNVLCTHTAFLVIASNIFSLI